MRRYISLVCVALIVVMCMASPVSAIDSSFSSDYVINVLDYVVADGDNFFSFSNSHTVKYELGFNEVFNSVDIVFYSTGPVVSSVMAGTNSFSELSVVQISSNLYRCYGSINSRLNSYINLSFNTGSSGTTYIKVLSFNAYVSTFDRFDELCFCEINAIEFQRTIAYNVNDDINYRLFATTSEFPEDQWLTLYLWSENWRKYDYLEFTLFTVCGGINSINCIMGTDAVPFEVSYIDTPPGMEHHYSISIVVDVSELDKSRADYPMITIEGTVIPSEDSVNTVNMLGCVGSVSTQTVDPDIFYLRNILSTLKNSFSNLYSWINSQTSAIQTQFTQLKTAISTHFTNLENSLDSQTDSIVAAIRGDTAPGDSFQQEVDEKDQQLNDMAAVMDSVERPELDSVNVSADIYVDQTVLATSMSGLTTVISMPVFLDVIMMSLIMATAGYVLFGKR